MMSLETIRALSARQTSIAAAVQKAPATLFRRDTVENDVKHCPWIGEYIHPRWRTARLADYEDVLAPHLRAVYGDDTYLWIFVDKTGFGDKWEPALTKDQTIDALQRCLEAAEKRNATLGVGIVEEGQYQLHIGLFEKVS